MSRRTRSDLLFNKIAESVLTGDRRLIVLVGLAVRLGMILGISVALDL